MIRAVRLRLMSNDPHLKHRYLPLFLVLGLLLASCRLLTPPAESRVIQGQVVDKLGQGLAGLEVQVEVTRQALKHVVVTNPQGHFELSYLLDGQQQRQPLPPRATLRISAWKLGFEPRELEVIYPGGRLILEPLRLEPELEELFTQPELNSEAAPVAEPLPTGRTGRGE